uniref:Uncharacterized protein n=1 Tax=Glossina pallidipes TaxID=7398 RepID=A0A1A9ZGV5_GLOPL
MVSIESTCAVTAEAVKFDRDDFCIGLNRPVNTGPESTTCQMHFPKVSSQLRRASVWKLLPQLYLLLSSRTLMIELPRRQSVWVFHILTVTAQAFVFTRKEEGSLDLLEELQINDDNGLQENSDFHNCDFSVFRLKFSLLLQLMHITFNTTQAIPKQMPMCSKNHRL